LYKLILSFFLLFVLLNTLDILTTIIGFELGAIEGNNLAKQKMIDWGLTRFWIFKLSFPFIVGFVSLLVIFYTAHLEPDYLFFVQKIFLIAYLVVSSINLYAVVGNVRSIYEQYSMRA
jgi:hypothetical protein